MNKYIVHKKVGHPVEQNSQAYKKHEVEVIHSAENKTQHTRQGENEKKSVIFFKPPFTLNMVVEPK